MNMIARFREWRWRRSRRYQLEAIALRLRSFDRIARDTSDDPLLIWEQQRQAVERALGLEPGSLNSSYGSEPFRWTKGWS